MPILGAVIRKAAVARFTRTLGTLVSSGVPILNGLEITARTSGNKVIEEAVLKTRTSISEGNTIAEPLRECGVFPPMVVQMIGVGEQTGALDEMLEKIADFYDSEVDTAVERAHLDHRADHDRRHGRHRGRNAHRDVPADVQARHGRVRRLMDALPSRVQFPSRMRET